MKVSIITPCFNSVKTIEDTFRSVFAQSYPNIEYIVVDGGSTDGTVELIEQYANQLTYWFSEPDRGVYDAMNKGIRLATGEIIAILNSDDIYVHSEVIRQVVELFQQHKTDSLYGDLQYVQHQHPERVVRHWTSGLYQRHQFLLGWMPPHPTFFVRRRVYEKYGLYRLDLRTSADYELMLRLLYKHRISTHYLPELLVRMRTGGLSNRSVRGRLRANWEDRQAWRLNQLRPFFFTAVLKPLRKVSQFVVLPSRRRSALPSIEVVPERSLQEYME